uniref:Nicotinamide riboside transporter PnuC n=1 Tax=Angiostrongylus cantonensis TaxID=6313 RepID=A0A0K0DQP6_ANGCA
MTYPSDYHKVTQSFFVQWIECSAVLLVGYAINVIRGFPPFQWIAAIGGVLYATGNIFAVPVVNGLGMGVAFLIWGSMQVIAL